MKACSLRDYLATGVSLHQLKGHERLTSSGRKQCQTEAAGIPNDAHADEKSGRRATDQMGKFKEMKGGEKSDEGCWCARSTAPPPRLCSFI
ncbi:hypothetical protein VZT92_016093 [Zoarces viviparus]|uniref:Uncharacterized protein n=1 Tax=Zoarces viviparus TaxID=48416 RepID=A0AAW1ERP6_ZOAVI